MGQEFRRKGVNIALGPVVGPLGRVAEGGRNWVRLLGLVCHGEVRKADTLQRRASPTIRTSVALLSTNMSRASKALEHRRAQRYAQHTPNAL